MLMGDADLPSTPVPAIATVAVIGAGVRGQVFALRCVEAGFRVVLQDVLASRLRAAQDLVAREAGHGQGQLDVAVEVEDAVRHADVAIDFVPDELESKLEIFSLLDRMAPPRTILCTPTALSIADLASCTYRADRCVALEPFEDHAAALHLRRGPATTNETASAAAAWLETLGAAVEISNESGLLP